MVWSTCEAALLSRADWLTTHKHESLEATYNSDTEDGLKSVLFFPLRGFFGSRFHQVYYQEYIRIIATNTTVPGLLVLEVTTLDHLHPLHCSPASRLFVHVYYVFLNVGLIFCHRLSNRSIVPPHVQIIPTLPSHLLVANLVIPHPYHHSRSHYHYVIFVPTDTRMSIFICVTVARWAESERSFYLFGKLRLNVTMKRCLLQRSRKQMHSNNTHGVG